MGVLRPALFHAFVLSHGVTDIDTGASRLIASYGPALFVPCRQWGITTAFGVASCWHMANDLGHLGASVFAHVVLAMVAYRHGKVVALQMVNQYLAWVHVPLHFRRAWCDNRRTALAVTTATTLGMTAYLYLNPQTLFWCALGAWQTEWVMRLAIGHVLCSKADVLAARLMHVM